MGLPQTSQKENTKCDFKPSNYEESYADNVFGFPACVGFSLKV